MNKPMYKNYLGGRQVVGVIASNEDLAEALKDPTVAHGFEFRVDCIDSPEVLDAMKALRKEGKFTILTVRDSAEGSKFTLSLDERRERFLRYISHTTWVDVEAANADRLTDVILAAKEAKVGLIISCHYFSLVPHQRTVYEALQVCERLKGDVFKIACAVEGLRDFREFLVLAENLFREYPQKLAPMCMGKKLFGKASRLIFADSGARFLYGSLANAVVPGQWKAAELMRLLA